MVDFDWENIDPNTPDEEMYELYVGSTLPVPEPVIVEDPHLPAPSQSSATSVSQVEPNNAFLQPLQWKRGRNLNITLTAIM